MPAPRRLLRPVAEAALSLQGTGASTAPGVSAATPPRPRPGRLGSGRGPLRPLGHRTPGGAEPEPGAAGALGSRGGLVRALGRRPGVRVPTLTNCAAVTAWTSALRNSKLHLVGLWSVL